MSAVNGVGSSTAPDSQTGTAKTEKKDELTDRNTFLKLLVAQMRYQNPLNPADGVQFMTQLAQFSSLEQTVQVSQDLSAIRKLLESQVGDSAGAQNQTTKQGS